MGDEEREQFTKITENLGGVDEKTKQIEEDLKLRERYTRLIGQLDSEQLGRAIVITKKGKETTSVRQADRGVDIETTPAPQETELVGYALPMGKGHLVLMTDGTMLKTETRQGPNLQTTAHKNEVDSNRYNETFAINAEPLDLTHIGNANSIINELKVTYNELGVSVIHDSRDPGNEAQFGTFLDEAIRVGHETKTKRDAAKRAGMLTAVDKLDAFLHPKPPTVPPQTPEPPQSPMPPPPQG